MRLRCSLRDCSGVFILAVCDRRKMWYRCWSRPDVFASILEAVERRRRAMFVEWSHSKWHQSRTGGMFPLPD